LVSVIDTAGRQLRIDWTDNRIRTVSVEGGPTTQYDYSPTGMLISVRDANGASESFEYDDWGRMAATTTKGGVRFIYEYDQLGRCGLTTGPNQLFYTRIEYDVARGRTVVHGAEPRVYLWNDLGLAERESLPDGTLLEEVAYDTDGFLTAKVDGSTEGYRYSYDPRGNLIEIIDPHGLKRSLQYEQDRVVRDIAADGRATEYRYEPHGALSWVGYPTGESYSFEYDDLGRLTRVSGPRGVINSYEYDRAHNVIGETDARGVRCAYTYDAVGHPTSRTDPVNRITRVRYDAIGRRSALELPDGTTRRFEHDTAGRLKSVTNGLGQTTRLTYSGIAALSRVDLPDGRAYQLIHNQQEKLLELKNPLGESHSYERDEVGRVALEHTFDGRELKYSYAAGGKLSRIDYPDGTFRHFEYSARGDLVLEESADLRIEFERDVFGRLMRTRSSGWNEHVETAFERDANGRVTAELQQGRRVAYARDVEGLVTQRALPNGAITRYEYDGTGTLAALDHDGFRVGFERDALGREIGRNASGGVRVEQKYDDLDRLLERRVVAPDPGGAVGAQRVASRRGYRYDRAGRVEHIDDARWGATHYRYDPAGRLLESRQAALHETFAHDGADSIVGWINQVGGEGGANQEQGQVGPGNVLLRRGTTEYRYDARGRRMAKIALDKDGKPQTTLYDWDGRDRLRRLLRADGTQLNYSYDAFGRRVHKLRRAADGELRNTNFIWDGEVLAAELDDQSGPRTFVHEPGGFEPILQQQGGETFVCVNDHLGMPKDLVSGDGLVVWTAAHSAYGKIVAVDADAAARARYGTAGATTSGARGTATPVQSPFRLLGQVADEDAELGWTRFRCFDAESGRWLSPDPMGVVGGLNLIGFDGPPNNVVDPLGLATGGGTPHGKASDLPVIKKGTKEWDDAVKDMSSMEKGKANYRTETASDAKDLLNESRGNMDRRKQYTDESYKKGYEVHNDQNGRELSAGNDLQHMKWYDGKSQGHIFYDKPN
jgi:RHS repeat-associated protein